MLGTQKRDRFTCGEAALALFEVAAGASGLVDRKTWRFGVRCGCGARWEYVPFGRLRAWERVPSHR